MAATDDRFLAVVQGSREILAASLDLLGVRDQLDAAWQPVVVAESICAACTLIPDSVSDDVVVANLRHAAVSLRTQAQAERAA